jgi:hypothetical protein
MHLQEITDQAIARKEKYSDWRRDSAQTPSNTVSAVMSMDHRFESMPKRGYWRFAAAEAAPRRTRQASTRPAASSRDEAYDGVLERLKGFGTVEPLPFGRTYYVLSDRIHLMLRFSKTHHRNNELEFFLGVSPQYFERIKALGHGFLVMVLGAADNVLLVPAEAFDQWVHGLETSGSGTWPMVFYQSLEDRTIQRWVPGGGREDVTAVHNDYAALSGILGRSEPPPSRQLATPLRVKHLLEAGLLKSGDLVYTKKCPDRHAVVLDSTFVEYEGQRWRYNDWGTHVTGWTAINIYREVILDRTGQTLDDLRQQMYSSGTR